MQDGYDDPIWMRVMRKCNTKLVEYMDPAVILDQFLKTLFLQGITVRDIRELPSTSEKNRKIIDAVNKRGIKGYEYFKTCLRETRQNQLADRLTKTENKLKQKQSDSSGEDEFYTNVLKECLPTLVEKLEPKSIIAKFKKRRFLLDASLRDIEEIKNTSDQIRAIIKAVLSKGSHGYTVFIKCLENTNQYKLVNYLSSTEDCKKQSSHASNKHIPIRQKTFDSEPYVLKQRNQRLRMRDSIGNINRDGTFGTLEDGIQYINGHMTFFPQKVLGIGSKSEVYEGTFGKFNSKPVAVKVVTCLNEQYAKETQMEIANIYRDLRDIETLNDPSECTNIIEFFGTFIDHNRVYFAYGIAKGTLHDYVACSNVSWQNSIPAHDVIQGIVDGLKYTHRMQIVHRDLKPANIFIVENSDTGLRAVIGDYGTAMLTTPTMLTSMGYMGSPGYIAPEIRRAMKDTEETLGPRCNKQSDIFALGLVICFTLSLGKHPYGNATIAQSEIDKASLPNFEQISSHINSFAYIELLRSMLNDNPTERPSIEEVSEHPALLTSNKVMELFVIKCDHFENLIKADPWKANLLEDPSLVTNWTKRLPAHMQKYFRSYKRNNRSNTLFQGGETSIRSLLRAVRNTKERHMEYPEKTQAELGDFPDGHVALWLKVCPELLMHVYDKLGPI